MSRITHNTLPYNERRYSSPWIARVDFNKDPKGVFTFGDFVGERGRAGLLVIDAPEGAIVAIGQKDYRGKGTSCTYYRVQLSGDLLELAGKAAAYKLAMS